MAYSMTVTQLEPPSSVNFGGFMDRGFMDRRFPLYSRIVKLRESPGIAKENFIAVIFVLSRCYAGQEGLRLKPFQLMFG